MQTLRTLCMVLCELGAECLSVYKIHRVYPTDSCGIRLNDVPQHE